MRLGEVLVQRGIITEKQLARALDAQLIFGAHLGTCLIELGYLEEDKLGHLLGDTFKVRYASRDLLQEIPLYVIKTLTRNVVEKHQAIPFDLKEKTLHVAMVNPRHLPSLDELSFVSGCRIEPWVAPEVRVFQAMERYYDVARKQRYIVLAGWLDGQESGKKGDSKGRSSTKRASMAAVATQSGVSQLGPAVGQLSPIDGVERAGESWPGVEETAGTHPSRPGPAVEDSLAGVSEEFCRADEGTRVAKAALNHAARLMARCILFAVKGDAAVVWETRGLRLDAEQVRGVRLPFRSEPLFGLLMGEPCYKGSVPEEARYRGFFETLGLSIPSEILLVPIYVGDRIAAIFYGDAGADGVIAADTDSYLRLTRKVALAMEMVRIKRMIRST